MDWRLLYMGIFVDKNQKSFSNYWQKSQLVVLHQGTFSSVICE